MPTASAASPGSDVSSASSRAVMRGSSSCDCRWPALGLTVELDGYRYHRSRHAWEQDLRREREAHARGDEFRRYTYGDVTDDPTRMLAELRELAYGSTSPRLIA